MKQQKIRTVEPKHRDFHQQEHKRHHAHKIQNTCKMYSI